MKLSGLFYFFTHTHMHTLTRCGAGSTISTHAPEMWRKLWIDQSLPNVSKITAAKTQF